MDDFDYLNNIYKPLCDRRSQISARLLSEGFTASASFYNNHFVRRGGEFAVEYYPIPVISVKDVGDIGLDIDTTFVELNLPREKALRLDYPQLIQNYNLEVYGAEDYLNDFYNESCGADADGIIKKIADSAETRICITFYFQNGYDLDEVIEIIRIPETVS